MDHNLAQMLPWNVLEICWVHAQCIKERKKKYTNTHKVLALIWLYWLFPYILIQIVVYINSNTAIINLGTINTLTCKPWLFKSTVLFWAGTICCPWKPVWKLFFQYRFSSLDALSAECCACIDSGSKSREGFLHRSFFCLFVHINSTVCCLYVYICLYTISFEGQEEVFSSSHKLSARKFLNL